MDARTYVEANATGFFIPTQIASTRRMRRWKWASCSRAPMAAAYLWEELAAAAPGASAGASGEPRP